MSQQSHTGVKKIINLTPHDLTLYEKCNTDDPNCVNGYKQIGIIPKEKNMPTPRCTEVMEPLAPIKIEIDKNRYSIPLVKKSFGKIENLPEKKENTYYYVSALTKGCAPPDRNDLLIGADSIRDQKGNILGISKFGL